MSWRRGEPDAWRRGRHLLAAGRAAEAVPLLLMAADGALGRSEYLAARRVLLAAARRCGRRGRRGDPAWSGVEVRWSRMTRVEGRMGMRCGTRGGRSGGRGRRGFGRWWCRR
ncbi:MAG: hypothetical protein R3F65_09405 [bacterium]